MVFETKDITEKVKKIRKPKEKKKLEPPYSDEFREQLLGVVVKRKLYSLMYGDLNKYTFITELRDENFGERENALVAAKNVDEMAKECVELFRNSLLRAVYKDAAQPEVLDNHINMVVKQYLDNYLRHIFSIIINKPSPPIGNSVMDMRI